MKNLSFSSKLNYVAVAGNIGVGKTTLVEKLSKHYGWTPYYEEVDNNPYIEDFYNDMIRWSFNLQIFFLQKKIYQLIEVLTFSKIAVIDRTFYEDIFIFATNLKDMGVLSVRDFENYFSFYNILKNLIQPPSLLIYMKASIPTLVKQIEERGRAYEQKININYLQKLNTQYNHWIEEYKEGETLTIDMDKNDFTNNPEDFEKIIRQINSRLKGFS
ncbi:MAG: deoxynucleoside kinase [Chitinophagaceae bacterium]